MNADYGYNSQMRMLLCLALLFLFVPLQNAFGADLFVKQPPVTSGTTPYAPKSVVPQASSETADPETSVPKETPTETINDFSARYYQKCLAKKDKIIAGANQQMLCACSAQKLVEQMTIEDVKTMATVTPEGQFQRNRMLLQVYAPCMEYPARALLHENCVNGANIKKKLPNYEQVCNCMADGMAQYVAQNGPSIIAKSLRDNPNDLNPLSNLMNSPDFQAKAQAELSTCITAPPPAIAAKPVPAPEPTPKQ
jgi:hypothetical protein